MAKGIVRKRKTKDAGPSGNQKSKEALPHAEVRDSASMESFQQSCEGVSEKACMQNEEEQADSDSLHNNSIESQAALSCTPLSSMTDEDFVEGIATAIEAEDIHFLVKTDFCIRPHLIEKIPNIEKLVVFLSTNLETEYKLKAIQLIKTLLKSVDLNDPRPLINNLKAASVDYTKLFYLKGKIEFMKHRLCCREREPENIVRE